jgi:uncharacterized protein (UPF0261 family)
MKKTILCVGTLDSKGPELQYIKELIEKRGCATLVMDIGSLESAPFTPDITAEEIAKAAGSTIGEVRALEEAGPAAKIMTSGAMRMAEDLFSSGRFQGVIAIGGGMGLSVASAVMRELPIGVPKFMLSSQKIVQAGIRKYVETKDIAIMPSVADIAGLNRLTKTALNNAVGAIVGMVESPEVEATEKPLVFLTMLGSPNSCEVKVISILEDKGFEVAVFHTVGIGGMTFEDLVRSYPVAGVIEVGLNEIGNELFGGFTSAGPNRLEAAGKQGVPQIIIPGYVDIINFLGPETVPDQYRDRKFVFHNPQATVMRTSADELKLIGETVARKLNLGVGPLKVLVPTLGFSVFDCEGGIFYDPAADKAFIHSLKSSLNKAIEVKEVDAHLNDDEFVKEVVNEFQDLLSSCKEK